MTLARVESLNTVQEIGEAMRTKDIALIALFAALTCALGFTPLIPLPFVTITFALQTLGILLAGGIIGAKRGALAMLLVLLLVALGLPVLTGGQGGLGKFVGPTAGFIWSWPIGAFLVGILVEHWWNKLTFVKTLIATLIGSVSLYPLGQGWLIASGTIPFSVGVWSWVAYLPGDIAKSIVAAAVIITVKKAYPLITPRSKPSTKALR